MSNIHPTAIIEAGAKIGNNVTIEPYVIVKGTVTLEDNVTIKSHAYIDGYTTIGSGTVIWPSASIGTKTQDLKFKGEKTFVKIGKNCEIREFVTINSSCNENSEVVVGDHCLIMAYCHIAHNCILGNHVIMANNSMLAGHVEVGDYANIGGMTPVHQFVRIGRYAMVGGFSRVTHDIPPFTIGAGSPYEVGGLNLVGLKRRGFALEDRMELTKAFKVTYRSGLKLSEVIEQLKNFSSANRYLLDWIDFCENTKRGLIGFAGITQKNKDEVEELKEELANT
ncbi:MAG: acyl-ACP--UDP-N-acetylglucosamine O-acyltransferase [Simkaniaceae bacterium]|nr:acyl-ACP--UDP-N-acetylglucosamine O-acyltransferase [Simkaniaceae bacterium]MCF7851897.1 acyl-ACP--UDP-N-acetylglucosamine O-acyltransferase [Simkaniaceae bacterium]